MSEIALHFSLRVNDTEIGYFEAVRIVGSDQPDSLNTYRVLLNGPMDVWEGQVQHVYGDGAWELVRNVLQAKKDADMEKDQ